MKAKVISLWMVLMMSTISCAAQQTITVEAKNNDISNNLDLQAVASVFGESNNLEDFEKRLNDYDSRISNLDLNNDGEVDYLRVVEDVQNNVHVVVIQAVLEKDVFQDVATIVVERKDNRRTIVQVIGDPYIYGTDYIIEPVYIYRPPIFSFFWSPSYVRWCSPYYYGYYPRYYRYYRPVGISLYISHVHSRINHDHRYYYGNRYRDSRYQEMHRSIGRNDYANRYPDRSFSSRNGSTVINRRSYDAVRSGNTIQERTRYNSGRIERPVKTEGRGVSTQQPSRGRVQDDIYQSRSSRMNSNQEIRNNNSQQNTRTSPGSGSVNRSSNSSERQSAPSVTNRTNNNSNSNSNSNYQRQTTPVERRQQTPVVRQSSPVQSSQPARSNESSRSSDRNSQGGRR